MQATLTNDRAANLPLRQVARRPSDGDGVGQALRQVFAQPGTMPIDFDRLLARIGR